MSKVDPWGIIDCPCCMCRLACETAFHMGMSGQAIDVRWSEQLEGFVGDLCDCFAKMNV